MPRETRSAVFPDLPWLARSWPQSTISRIAIILFIGLAISMAIILGFIARVTQGQLDADARALILAERAAVTQAFDRDGVASAIAIIHGEMRMPGPLAVLLLDGQGRALAGNIAAWPADLPADDRFRRRDLMRNDRPGAETFALFTSPLPAGHRLMVGRSLEEQERLTQTLTTSLVAAIGLSLVLAVGISLVLTQTIAARVQAVADVAGAVAAGDLTRRVALPADGSRDAFDSLGDALNTMLVRIEALLDELRSVTDGLAHDLRSPLTRMKARIDRMARSGDESGQEIAAIGHEADALLAMLETSLEISRVEAGIGRDGFRQMDLAALVNDMVEMYEPLAEDSGVQLTALAATPVPVRAHRELLGRALSNLIDNALRYGASGGSIEVSAETTAAGACLSVADHGPGIARAAQGDALRRFGRLDVARPAGGAGLGLSLAAAIARLHGGALQLLSNRPGLRVTIDLPGEG